MRPSIPDDSMSSGTYARAESYPLATVMVVDDEPTICRMSQRILERAGYRVLTALSGPEALTCCAAHEGAIDLFVIDLSLVGLSGRELQAAFANVYPHARVLYISGYSEQDAAAREVRNEAFLAKPFSPAALVTMVMSVLEEAREGEAPPSDPNATAAA